MLFVRNEPDQYLRTCQAWLDRLGARTEDATALVGPQLVGEYRRYLKACIHGFAKRHLGLIRIVFERID